MWEFLPSKERGEREQRRVNAPGAFSWFFRGHLPQTSGFSSAKQYTHCVVRSIDTLARACILSDHNIFYTPSGGGTSVGHAPGAFLVSFEFITLEIGFLDNLNNNDSGHP